MPRCARIDHSGLLVHVMARGIDRCLIFTDDRDRYFLLDRLSSILEETDTILLAWALMPNHFHLLTRLSDDKMAVLMRRLLTSYAKRFNQRHQRVGHLFQNRYKSLICEEQVYLLELIRYIHLNPVRGGLVESIDDLDRYRWCGHSVLMGNRRFSVQSVDEVLGIFGPDPLSARKDYRRFLEQGVSMGPRPDLAGDILPSFRKTGQGSFPFGVRMLGSKLFQQTILEKTPQGRSAPRSLPLEHLLARTAGEFLLPPSMLMLRGRENAVSDARAAFCWLAIRKFGYKPSEVARFLGISGVNVSRALRRGAPPSRGLDEPTGILTR